MTNHKHGCAGPTGSVPSAGALTPREGEVARLVAGGHTNKEIARTLGVGITTAKWHVSRILAKLGLQGRVQLAVYARDHLFPRGLPAPVAWPEGPPEGPPAGQAAGRRVPPHPQ